MMKRITRMLSAALGVILSISMLISTLPITAFATEVGAGNGGGEMPTGDVAAFEATGDGTEANPWKISDLDSLYAFASKANNDESFSYEDCYVELTADITMPSGSEWYGVRDFNGTFNGNNHTINNLTIGDGKGENVGFFRTISAYATICNLQLLNASLNLSREAYAVGILAGSTEGANINNCTICGNVTIEFDGVSVQGYDDSAVGGYIGRMSSPCTIEKSSFTGTIYTNRYIRLGTGGFAGLALGPCVIKSCVVTGKINSNGSMGGSTGGFVGIFEDDEDHNRNEGMHIVDCSNMANINSKISNEGDCGGIIGTYEGKRSYTGVSGTIERCINSGDITGYSAGGLIGYGSYSICISESVNKGRMDGYISAGGICSDWSGAHKCRSKLSITDCYNTGSIDKVYGAMEPAGIISFIIGYGSDSLDISRCYVFSDAQQDTFYGITSSIDDMGTVNLSNLYVPEHIDAFPSDVLSNYKVRNVGYLSTTTLKQKSSFVGFDFNTVWKMTDNGPTLQWETDTHTDTGDGNLERIKELSWPLVNMKKTFWGGTWSTTKWQNYFTIIGPAVWFGEVLANLVTWGHYDRGWCFGLSMLSITEDNGQTDIQTTTQKEGSTLSEYGYSSIAYGKPDKNGRQRAYCKADETLTDIIEKAQYGQFAIGIKKAESKLNRSDINTSIGDTIEEMVKDHAILVKMRGVSHAVVIPRGSKGVRQDDKYDIQLYDPNAPQVNAKQLFGEGVDYNTAYNHETSWLVFNYADRSVSYLYYDLEQKQMIKEDAGDIIFVDPSKLGQEFFYGKYALSDEDNTKTFISANSAVVFDENGKPLFEKSRGTVRKATVDWDFYVGDVEEKNSFEWMDVPNGTYQYVVEGESMIATISDNDQKATTITSDGNLRAAVGESGKIVLNAQGGTVTFEVKTSVDDNKYATIKGKLNEGESLEIEEKNGIVQGKTNSTGSVEGSVYKGDEVFQYDIDFDHDEGKQDVPEGIFGGKGEIIGTTDAMEYRSVDQADAEWISCSNESTTVDPGNYEVRYAARDNLGASEAVRVTVLPKDEEKHPDKQNPPEGIAGGKGEITGTTTDMEYRKLGDVEWTRCDNDATSADPGDYEVRYAETDEKEPSSAVQVTVQAKSDNKKEDISGGSTSANNQSTSRRSNAAVEKQSHTHQYEWKTVKEATEDQNGEADYICVECGDVAYRSPISSFYIYNQNVAKSIRNCPKNGIVNVDATKRDWISFSSMFSQALQERPDVTVVLRYNYGAGTCKMTIPAGSYQIVQELFDKDGTKDKNGHGLFCGYLNLATKFPVIQMK